MPVIMLGRERFALPIGETRVGGVGPDALPFQPLRRLPTVAVLLVTASETVSLWPQSRDAGAVLVDGVPLGAEPVPIAHGAKIKVAGVRLIFRDGRETGSTGPTAAVTREVAAVRDERAGPAPAEAARLFRRDAAGPVEIPDSGLVIGRDPDSDLVVSGMEVSRRHAIVRRSVGGYLLTDVSRNGTWVNGRRAAGAVVLHTGDVIRVGEEEFRFETGGVKLDPAATQPALRPQPFAEPRTVLRAAARIWPRLSSLWRA